MTAGDVLERATALPKAVIQGVGKLTGQSMTMEPTEPVHKTYGERGAEAGASTVIPNQATTLLTQASPYVPYNVTGTGLVGIAETSSTASTAGAIQVVEATPATTSRVP